MTAPAAMWQAERNDAAAQRILDTAEGLYAANGVDGVTMRALAAEVGCSRATLYRYFPSREAVQAAFIDRSAARLARRVADSAPSGTAVDRLVTAVTTALRMVRETPAFATWFRADGVATAAQLATVSPVIETLARNFLSGPDQVPHAEERARWLVRVMLSLLTTPGTGVADEERMLRSFVAPVVVG